MNCCPLLERLMEIERAIGVEDSATVRRMVIAAQECYLKMQKESVESLRPKLGPNRTSSNTTPPY